MRLRDDPRRNGAIASPMEVPKRVFFRKLKSENTSSVIARRLRSAIGLGIISDGERLPREPDLAEQLGVSSSALREGLGILRSEGLILTRPGKNGGSFVQTPAGTNLLVSDDLMQISANDLRDLADWREMLATKSAALAAARSSPSTVDRLRSFATELELASSTHDASRALGRFHIELALGAQSLRLSMAQFMMHEEFDWFTTTLLSTDSGRRSLAVKLLGIADAVQSRDEARASALSSAMVSSIASELARTRLGLLAKQHQPRPATGEDPISGLIAAVHEHFKGILDLLTETADQFAKTITRKSPAPEIERALAEMYFTRLDRIDAAVHGIGFLVEPGALQGGQKYFMLWWQRNAQGVLVPDTHHVMDTSSDDFYDYSDMELLTGPRRHGEPVAMGPFIDHGGVDDYLITASVPVHVDSEFFGVLAADTRVADFESLLAPWLVAAPGTVVVTNAENRILLSNTPAYAVGNMLHGPENLHVTDVGLFGWRIAS